MRFSQVHEGGGLHRFPALRALALAAVVATSFAGCSEAADRQGLSLSSFASCNHSYPDGSPVDCGENLSAHPAAEPPDGWVCFHRLATSGQDAYELWWDGGDRYGVRYDLPPGAPLPAQARFAVGPEGSETTVFAELGTDEGFLELPGSIADQGNFTGTIRAFAAYGKPGWLSNETLKVHQTEYQGYPWYVWVLNGTHYFQSMHRVLYGSKTAWHPIGGITWNGQDFTLTINMTLNVQKFIDFYQVPPTQLHATFECGMIQPPIGAANRVPMQ